MSPEMKDQVAEAEAEGQSPEKPLSLDEQIDRGWEQVELLTEQENAAKAKAKEGQPKAGETKPEGPAEKPYRVLKVGGKEIPVKSEEELIELAQKGADYTKKTQALADDRRDAEDKIKKETDRVTEAMERAADLAERLMKAGVLPRKLEPEKGKEDGGQEIPEDLAKIYEEFQLDPANAYPHEKRYVAELAKLREGFAKMQEERRLERQAEADRVVSQTIEEERKAHPFENIVDDQGNDVTMERIRTIVSTKHALSGVKEPPRDQVLGWLKEAVREVHFAQKGNGQPAIDQTMDLEAFQKQYPDLAKKLLDEAKEKSRLDKSKLPPTLTPGKRDVDTAKKPSPKATAEGKSAHDWIEEGFSDPDVIKAITGG